MKQIQRSLLIMVLLMIPMLVSAAFSPTLGFYGIRLMLPIQVKDVINEYIFEFGLTHKLKYPELVVDAK